jgi:hypothetical protein
MKYLSREPQMAAHQLSTIMLALRWGGIRTALVPEGALHG